MTEDWPLLLPCWKEEGEVGDIWMSSYGTDPGRQPEAEAGAAGKRRRTVWLSRKPSRTDKLLYALGLILLAAGLGFALLQIFAPETAAKLHWPFPCPFDSLLHIPCLGCGATRALRALVQGRLWESALWHPAVPFFAAEAAVFLISQTLGRMSRGRVRMLTFNDVYVYALLAVILLQWIIKLLTGWRP